MSLFTCLDIIKELQQYFIDTSKVDTSLDVCRWQIEEASLKNKPLLLKRPMAALKELAKEYSFFSVLLRKPLYKQDFYAYKIKDKLYDICIELEECLRLSEIAPLLNIHSFQLPSIKAPRFSSEPFIPLYNELKEDLRCFKNKSKADYIYDNWQKFCEVTRKQKANLARSKGLSWWFDYQVKRYLELRQGMQNQMALSYFCHKNKISDMNYQMDWRRGTCSQTGYGYVMAMALPSMQLRSTFVMNAQVDIFERDKLDSEKDQKDIKHNRITSLSVATISDRAKELLDLAKQNINQHLKIKLLSRGFSERYSYLQFIAKDAQKKIIFCEPRHGVFEFDNEDEFLFFYEMIYAKEQMQNDLCWNRYQVSIMRYAPNEKVIYTWAGKLRSLLTGLKYNISLIDRVKNFFLFNITLSIFLIVSYALTCAIATISPVIGTFLLSVLAQNIGSTYISLAFMFGSAGVFATWDVIYATALTLSDNVKPFLGLRSDYDEILHKPFELTMSYLKDCSSHQHLIHLLGVERQEVETCVESMIKTIEKDTDIRHKPSSDVDVKTERARTITPK